MKTKLLFLLIAALFVITGCKKDKIDNDSGNNSGANVNLNGPLCFTAEEDNSTIAIHIYRSEVMNFPNIEYSYDTIVWETYVHLSTEIRLEHAGDKVYFRGNNPEGLYANIPTNQNLKFDTYNKKFTVSGNLMSLIDPSCKTTSVPDYCFRDLFSGTYITTPPALPATTLGKECYCRLFSGCIYLKTAPELPATTMANDCYRGMFWYCISLKDAPQLPAITLADNCYESMFDGSGIIEAPELPAMTLADKCYANMFTDCKQLTKAPRLPATSLKDGCYMAMFLGCSKLTAAPELPATSLANDCYAHMFAGCKSITTTPRLPALSLADRCYETMFGNCDGLTTVLELPATTLANGCYSQMFHDCINLTNIPDILPATTLTNSCYEAMFYNCANLEKAPELPATTLASRSYMSMFKNCSSLKSIKVHLPEWGDELDTYFWVLDVQSDGVFYCPSSLPQEFGVHNIPEGWTVVTF